MIRNFKDREAEKLFQRQPSRKLPPEIQRVALRKLRMLSRATIIADLAIPPGNRLEKLEGDRAGQHSIRINNQCKICFVWDDGDVHEIEIYNYH